MHVSSLCCRWLDEGEDDGKIVREIKVQDEYMDDILAKRNVGKHAFYSALSGPIQLLLFSTMTLTTTAAAVRPVLLTALPGPV